MLIVQWMRGYPIARIISERISYNIKNNRKFAYQSVIRSTLTDIDQIARFSAPKFLACYSEVLHFFLTSTGREELASRIPELSVPLEIGATQTTQISLISLGLSRGAAIALSEFIASAELNEGEALDWLVREDLDTLDLPPVYVREIRNLLSLRNT